MRYIYDMIEHATELTGDRQLAEEMMKAIPFSDNEKYVLDQMQLKYETMCIKRINAGQCTATARLNGTFYRIIDTVDNTETICLIDTDGKIEFFNKVSEFKNLADYVEQCMEDEEDA